MRALTETPAVLTQPTAHECMLSGQWTARGIGPITDRLDNLQLEGRAEMVIDGSQIEALDTVGAWKLRRVINRLHESGATTALRGWRSEHTRLLDLIDQQPLAPAAASRERPALERLGRSTVQLLLEVGAMLSFVGETTFAFFGSLAAPARIRWRPILHSIQTAGFNALPIVGLLAFLLGTVVAYQGASQLSRYGADIFVADLIGLSMFREFSPLITAIIVAGRSGSAFTAQIGTMAVTEEIDAMRTIGIDPFEQLVLPKIIALLIVLPLLTVYADVLGVMGGMFMAQAQLGVGFGDFLNRLLSAISLTDYMVGVGKSPVFAAIIGVVGCFHGFRTKGGADSVGRQTTRSVVHSIFLVIVTDALFSIAFSVLHL
jgi:phospholipid/cholesterol/gamma-HCH transport system permease protein